MSSKDIKAKAMELGYTACGIIPVASFDEYIRELDERSLLFPKSKKHYDRYREFASLPEDGKSIIVCTQRYTNYSIPEDVAKFYGKMYLFDNRIDYTQEHRTNTEFEKYMQMLGLGIIEKMVPDRWAGARAGVGKFGYNNFLFDEKHGSYIRIKTWVVDKELEYDPDPESIQLKACSENCLKCVEACPTGAMTGKFKMDAGKCACRVQFDEEDALNDDMKGKLGLWIYGCDACQDACPMNKNKFNENDEYPLLKEFENLMKPEDILAMDEETYKRDLNQRFWYSGEEHLWLWKCNALRSMINSGDDKYHALIKKYCSYKDDRVSATAKWGCEKLGI